VHGAADDEDRYVVNLDDAAEQLVRVAASVTFFGHTHIQGAFRRQNGMVEDIQPEYTTVGKNEAWDMQLETRTEYLVNPGSVGQPRDGDWRAAFAMFNSETRVVTFWRVAYDLRAAQDRIFAANLPPRLATRLAAGR